MKQLGESTFGRVGSSAFGQDLSRKVRGLAVQGLCNVILFSLFLRFIIVNFQDLYVVKTSNCVYKDHHDKIKLVPDPVVKDQISNKLWNT